MKFYLVRHGETDFVKEKRFQGRIDTVLNKTGIEQVKKLANALKDYPFSAIYSSRLQRAFQTASIIRKHHPTLSLFIESDFMEINLGQWEGLKDDEIKGKFPILHQRWWKVPHTMRFPDGENFGFFYSRVANKFEELVEKHKKEEDSEILIVAHGGTINAILNYVSGLKDRKFFFFRINPASISTVSYNPQKYWWSLDVLNDTSHLMKKSNDLKFPVSFIRSAKKVPF